jgi:hypothetical protein
MLNRARVISAVLTAALLLAFAACSAAGNRLSYSNKEFRIVWSSLTFSESGGGLPITCHVTLEGSFHERTFAKTPGALSAFITSATIGVCQEGNATILGASLPWHVTYQSFSGTLPSITGVRYALIGAAFQVEPGLGILCLARTTVTSPAAGNARRDANGRITSLGTDSTLAIPVTGSPECPRSGIFSGSGEVFVQGSSETRVTLTLI